MRLLRRIAALFDRRPDVCESCGAPADVRLDDRSTWCIPCDLSARRLGYDNRRAKLLRSRRTVA